MTVLMDGAYGTELLEKIPPDRPCSELNLTHPSRVSALHRAYLDAGACILRTNTFMARTREEVLAGVRLAREAAGKDAQVYGSLGPAAAPEACRWLVEGGVSAVVLETYTSLAELRRASARARAAGLRLVIASLAAEHLPVLDDLDTPAVNCVDPEAAVRAAKAAAGGRFAVFPSAGLPNPDGSYPVAPAAFADAARRLRRMGAWNIGGCCGVGPAHIKAMAEALR